MRRLALLLTIACVFCVGAQAQAHDYYGHRGPHHGGPAPVAVYRHGWAPPVFVAPPYRCPPPVRYRYYAPSPAYGFYYQNRGVSIGIGF